MRKILAAAVLAAAAVAAVGKVEAGDAGRAPLARKEQKHVGKLVKVFEEVCPPEVDPSRLPHFRAGWVLKTADATRPLNLSGRDLTRLAEALEGRDVVVTGPLLHGEIEVRGLEAKPKLGK
jgi:hypothetical protein